MRDHTHCLASGRTGCQPCSGFRTTARGWFGCDRRQWTPHPAAPGSTTCDVQQREDVVLAASARTPVCFRAVPALPRGGVLTRAQSISRNSRISARFPRVGQRHPPCPSTAVAAIDLANLLHAHLRLIECGVGRRLENGALAAAHPTGGRPVRAESATKREKQRPGASASDRRHCFIRHPQVMAQATPCIRRKT